jgi:L-ascorbate metabolism protein UlaG (beta-lactamase superfamily)
MKIHWLGHASFLIECNGRKIITDPFDEKIGYPVYSEAVDIATVSHDHWDHNSVENLKGSPIIIRETGEFKIHDIKISGFKSYHDKNRGKDRGLNNIYKFDLEQITVLHMGDLGHVPDPELNLLWGKIDILMIPVGGVYTINADEAYQTVQLINPQITIPMHFNTPELSFNLGPVETFTSKFDWVVKKPWLEVSSNNISEQGGIVVLDHTSRLTR